MVGILTREAAAHFTGGEAIRQLDNVAVIDAIRSVLDLPSCPAWVRIQAIHDLIRAFAGRDLDAREIDITDGSYADLMDALRESRERAVA